jgi:hypothetical protein
MVAACAKLGRAAIEVELGTCGRLNTCCSSSPYHQQTTSAQRHIQNRLRLCLLSARLQTLPGVLNYAVRSTTR